MCYKRPVPAVTDINAVNFRILHYHFGYVLLEDMSHLGGCSLTNAIEPVLRHLFNKDIIGCLSSVYYVDSDGVVDEARHSCGEFTEFRKMGMSLKRFAVKYKCENDIKQDAPVQTIGKDW